MSSRAPVASIPTDSQVEAPLEGLKKFKFDRVPSIIPDEDVEDEDPAIISVYGSKYAAQDLPKTEMPEKEMPREVVYRMIKDDLTLDGNPTLKSVHSTSRLRGGRG